MELMIHDNNFNAIYVLDSFQSFLWVDRFNEPGSFELYTPITDDILKYVKPNYFITKDDTDHIMIIEDISYESDVENGNRIKAVGRSLESILDRRIVWKQTNFNNVAIDTVMTTLLNDAIVSPTMVDRKIENFAAYTASADPYITGLKVNHQYTGDNLLEVISSICVEFGIGFKITINDAKQFVFSLYRGTNRSYAQNDNPYVIFSPEFDNIISSNFTNQTSTLKNVALVGGTGTGTSRTYKTVGTQKGLDRREMFTDAASIQKGSLSNAKYNALLEKKGLAALDEVNRRITFDSECDATRTFVYGKDFFIGDIVQVANEYGIESASRVTEFTYSISDRGIETYPTFIAIEKTIVTGKNLLATTLANLKSLNTSGEWVDNVWCNSDLVLTVNTDAHDRVIGITVDGKNSTNSAITFILGEIQSDTTDLILSGCTGGASATYSITVYDNTSSATRATNYDGDTVVSGMVLANVNQCRFTIKSGKSVDNLTLYPMVRTTAENSDFEPYDPELHT